MSVSTIMLTWPVGRTDPHGITRDVTVSGPVDPVVSAMLAEVRDRTGGRIVVLDHDTRARATINF